MYEQDVIFISNFQIVDKVDEQTFKRYDIEKSDAFNLKTSLHKLLSDINGIQLGGGDTETHSGGYIFTLFKKANVSQWLKFLREM